MNDLGIVETNLYNQNVDWIPDSSIHATARCSNMHNLSFKVVKLFVQTTEFNFESKQIIPQDSNQFFLLSLQEVSPYKQKW